MKKSMKTIALLAALLLAPGCAMFQGSLEDQIAVDLKSSTDKILPQYLAYVEADGDIPGSVKQVRLDNAAKLAEIIEKIQPKE